MGKRVDANKRDSEYGLDYSFIRLSCRKRRSELKLTQSQLAQNIGVSTITVVRMESEARIDHRLSSEEWRIVSYLDPNNDMIPKCIHG